MWQSEDRGRELLSSALVGCTWWGAGIGGKLGFKQCSGETKATPRENVR